MIQKLTALLLRQSMTLVMIAMTLCLTSCGRNDQVIDGKVSDDQPFQLEAVLDKYSRATHYSDQAKVILNYSLNGAPFEEIHPCRLMVTRDQSFRFNRFHVELVSNSQVTLARVLDSDSQNLGGQVLCADLDPSETWNQICKDPIGSHFANGESDIPWSSRVSSTQISRLLNVAFHLFAGQPPEWLSRTCLKKSSRIVVGERAVHDATFNSPFGLIDCRFDAETKVLLGIRLPNGILSNKISSASGISNVSLAIIFEGASFDSFTPQPPKLGRHERPVKQFVRLPEEFPSKAIGEKIQSWDLIGSDNSPFNPQVARGSPTVFLYGIPSQYRLAELDRIESLTRNFPFAHFAWVSPTNLENQNGGFKFSRMGYFVDSKGKLLQFVGMQKLTFLLITDQNGLIQFVAAQDDDWIDKVGPVLDRIKKGENVAREMHNEYAEYYTKYQDELNRVQADDSIVSRLR